MQGERAVVTGGAGFIGSHLCEALLEAGNRVTALDDFSSGSRDNLAELIRRFGSQLEVVEGDVLDRHLLRQVLKGAQVVFHLAALTSVEESLHRPERMHAVNCTGTLGILECSRQAGVRKLVFSSSTAVYGQQAEQPQHELLLPRPASPYAVAKLAGEYYCRVYARTFGLPAVSLRYFNVYGPRQPADSAYAAVIPRFIRACSSRVAPTIYGDGLQTRDFIFVQDVARANLRAAASGCNEGCFNIATGRSHNLLELLEILRRLMGVEIEPRYEPARQGEVRTSQGATVRASEQLGFKAECSMEQGLEQTVKWYARQEAQE